LLAFCLHAEGIVEDDEHLIGRSGAVFRLKKGLREGKDHTGKQQEPCSKQKPFFKLGAFPCLNRKFLQEADVREILFFESPELEQMNQDGNDQKEKEVEDFRVFKLHPDVVYSKV
jgi:hypothetical protein